MRYPSRNLRSRSGISGSERRLSTPGECWKAERGLGSGFFKTGWKTKSDGHPAQECALRLFLNRKYKYRRKYTLACAIHHRPSTNIETYAHFGAPFFVSRARCARDKEMRNDATKGAASGHAQRVRIANCKPHCGMRLNPRQVNPNAAPCSFAKKACSRSEAILPQLRTRETPESQL